MVCEWIKSLIELDQSQFVISLPKMRYLPAIGVVYIKSLEVNIVADDSRGTKNSMVYGICNLIAFKCSFKLYNAEGER